MSAKNEILARVRNGVAPGHVSREQDYAAIPRGYRFASTIDRESRLHLFEERLREYGAGVYRCNAELVSKTIAHALAARDKKRLVVAPGVPGDWLPSAPYSLAPDDGLSYGQLDASEGVLTGCTVAIALTGTLVLRHSAFEGRRAIGLIPDYHLCVVKAEQVMETVPEAIRSIENPSVGTITTISGPSATADIEMTRIKGVHGPRTLDVILVLNR